MALLTDRHAALQQALAQRYRLERPLGEGGMATVHLALDLRHRRQVALKVLKPELALAIGPERFLREIITTANLRHPNILPLYDSGEAAGLLFYVMPYVAGESLRDRLRRERWLDLEEALAIVREVGGALDYAHGLGVIHRDIKPENILLERGHAVIADFGIARPIALAGGEHLTATGLAVGTPAYMSPEQAAGEPEIDGKSDLYSLAVVLFELLAGEPPFTGHTAQAIMARRFREAPPSIRRARPSVSTAVDQAIQRALALEPADRFPDCATFVSALSRPAPARHALPSVAVLPFLNLSPDPANAFFADGVTEDVIAQLAKIRSLKVIARSSTARFNSRERDLREIGQRLQVGHLVEGSVRRAGDRVRIVAQLVDTDSEGQLWAATYDRELTDIFAIQGDVAEQIARALEVELRQEEQARLRREPTASLPAYQAYLKGRACYIRYTKEDVRKGIEYFHQAIAADPEYAMAYTALALAYAERAAGEGGAGDDLRPEDAHRLALTHVTRALELDPELGPAHAVLALLKFSHDFDWAGAEAEFKLAIELAPGNADTYDHYGWMCSSMGRHEEAIALVRRAQELDPLTHRSDVATELLRAGRLEEALVEAERTVQFDSAYPRGRATLGWALFLTGRREEGLKELELAAKLSAGANIFLAQLGQAYALVGQVDKARAVLRELEDAARTRFVSPYHVAYIYTGLGEHEKALDLIEQTLDERAGSVQGIKGSFLFAPLRGHPRLQRVLERMHLA